MPLAGEFARRSGCLSVLNASSHVRLHRNHFDVFSALGMRAKEVCLDERHLARAGGPATATGARSWTHRAYRPRGTGLGEHTAFKFKLKLKRAMLSRDESQRGERPFTVSGDVFALSQRSNESLIAVDLLPLGLSLIRPTGSCIQKGGPPIK
jgi:hypothetical protein